MDAERRSRSSSACRAAGGRLNLEPTELKRREKELTGTTSGSPNPHVALPLLEYLRTGAHQFEPLIGAAHSLDDVNQAIDGGLRGAPGRVVVTP
jgi:Zn-dependent alcohol dehydrogenase